MPDNIGDTFRVAFRGSTVECSSMADAVAFKTADAILTNAGPCDQSPSQLDRIADVLRVYGHVEAADVVTHLAKRTRAMQFLIGAGTEPGKPHQPFELN
jgi:hypothetical protein